MPEIFLGEFNTDILPPTITNLSPANLATNVAEGSDVSFDALDESGIDTSTMTVTFNGVPAILSGAIQPGYAATYTSIAGGTRVVIDPGTDFQSLTSFFVSVTVRDLAPIYNEIVSSWLFTTGDFFPPLIVNRDPAPAAVDVLVTSAISFDVIDVNGSGINLSSLDMSLVGETFTSQVIVNGVIQPGYIVTVTAITGGYHVSADVIGDLLISEDYVVNVYVQDVASNPATSSWSWSTELGIYETPVLGAIGLDASVFCSWSVNPAMRVTRFELRRSRLSFPLTPAEGDLVYSGPAQSFTDHAVVNGTTYFYTVFVVSNVVLGVPLYVAYEPPASADAQPLAVTLSEGLEREYVPTPGELGTTVTLPWPHGKLLRVWGQPLGGGLRSDHDVWLLSRGREVVSPVSGTVSDLGPHLLSLDTDTGVRVTIRGEILPSRVLGERVEPGELVASALGGEAVLQLNKLAVGSYGKRSIRPSYLYLRTERRSLAT